MERKIKLHVKRGKTETTGGRGPKLLFGEHMLSWWFRWIPRWIPWTSVLFLFSIFYYCYYSSYTTIPTKTRHTLQVIPQTNHTVLPLIYQSSKPWNPTTGQGFPYQRQLVKYSFLYRLLNFLPKGSFLSRWYSFVHQVARYESIDLKGGIVSVGEYYIQIEIGGTPFRVQVDTGSSTLAVPMEGCSSCRKSSFKYSSNFTRSSIISCSDRKRCTRNVCKVLGCSHCSSSGACCADRMPEACGFFLRYGDGSGAEGALVRDIVKVGNTTVDAIFGGILHDTTDFERSSVDGILGLGYPALGCTPSCIDPLIDSMYQQSKIERDMFSICLSTRGGHLVLGGYDSSMAASEITFVPMTLSSPPTFYAVSLGGSIGVDNEELKLDGFDKGVVDSGSTLFVVSDQAFLQLKSYFQSHYCQVPGLCDAQHSWFDSAACAALRESDLEQLPTLTLHIANMLDLILTPHDYMLRVQQNGYTFYCLGIQSLPSTGSFVILGNTVMTKIGFALAGDCHVVGCERYTSCESCSLDSSCVFHIPSGTCQPKEDFHSLLGIYPSCGGRFCFCKLIAFIPPRMWTLLVVLSIILVLSVPLVVIQYFIRRRWWIDQVSESDALYRPNMETYL